MAWLLWIPWVLLLCASWFLVGRHCARQHAQAVKAVAAHAPPPITSAVHQLCDGNWPQSYSPKQAIEGVQRACEWERQRVCSLLWYPHDLPGVRRSIGSE